MVTAAELQQARGAGSPAAPSGGGGVVTAIEAGPITLQHPVEALQNLDKHLPHPGMLAGAQPRVLAGRLGVWGASKAGLGQHGGGVR